MTQRQDGTRDLKCYFGSTYIYRASRKFIINTPKTAKVFKDPIQQASSTRPGVTSCTLVIPCSTMSLTKSS